MKIILSFLLTFLFFISISHLITYIRYFLFNKNEEKYFDFRHSSSDNTPSFIQWYNLFIDFLGYFLIIIMGILSVIAIFVATCVIINKLI